MPRAHVHSQPVLNYGLNFAATNLTTTYVEVTSAMPSDSYFLLYSCNGNATCGVELGMGASGSEVVILHLGNGASSAGNRVSMPIHIPKGVRLAIRTTNGLGATNTTGQIGITLLGGRIPILP